MSSPTTMNSLVQYTLDWAGLIWLDACLLIPFDKQHTTYVAWIAGATTPCS